MPPHPHAEVFDPFGDHNQNSGAVGNVTDGDPSTTWSSHLYTTPDFGRLKPGVGIRLNLGRVRPIRSVEVLTRQSGWRRRVYLADRPAGTFEGWGPPRAEGSDIVSLNGEPARYVLLWLSALPPSRYSPGGPQHHRGGQGPSALPPRLNVAVRARVPGYRCTDGVCEWPARSGWTIAAEA